MVEAAPAKRVRRTKAQIAADNAALEAKRNASAEEKAAQTPTEPWQRTIHFLEDGHTFGGKVRYYGEEITIVEGTHEFDLAFDKFGNFIFDQSAEDQIKRWGKPHFAVGPWTGLPYETDFTGQTFDDGTPINIGVEERKSILEANQKQGNA